MDIISSKLKWRKTKRKKKMCQLAHYIHVIQSEANIHINFILKSLNNHAWHCVKKEKKRKILFHLNIFHKLFFFFLFNFFHSLSCLLNWWVSQKMIAIYAVQHVPKIFHSTLFYTGTKVIKSLWKKEKHQFYHILLTFLLHSMLITIIFVIVVIILLLSFPLSNISANNIGSTDVIEICVRENSISNVIVNQFNLH